MIAPRFDRSDQPHPDLRVCVTGTTLRLATGARHDLSPRPERRIGDVEVLWLTPAEQSLIEQVPIDGSRGLGAAIAALLLSTADHAPAELGRPPGSSPPHDSLQRHVLVMARGLIAAVAGERVESGVGRVTPHQGLVIRGMQIVHGRLDDPQLTSESVARQLDVSLRTLQAAFRESAGSLTSWIWALRLERAQLEVADTESLSRSAVAAVGRHWGFTGPAHFSRAYERRFGVRPGELTHR